MISKHILKILFLNMPEHFIFILNFLHRLMVSINLKQFSLE